ncbi:TreTu family toxin [Streptosporangium saharense]|uniref:TreTu family toxin n=1 Tax=Streptosporangium saharense TaxID=1706840 RepID=UPI00332D3AB0
MAQPPDTPDQLSGSAAGLPSLVSGKATTTSVKVAASVARKAARPKGALPVEARSVTFTDYCSSYPYYNSATVYPAGSVVAYSGHIWHARMETVGTTPGSGWSYWIDDGVCPPPPDPDPTGQAPSVMQWFPSDQMLMDSRTPLLVAGGYSNDGSYPVQFTFKVCDNENMTGSGCQSSGELAEEVTSWRVPVAYKLAWSKQYWWEVKIKDAHSGATTTSDTWTFTTGVRQPAITSQLATRGVNGQEFHQLAGNYTTSATDATVASAGPSLSIVRSYNSMDPRRDGLFGAGWSTRFDMKVQPETGSGVNTLVVTYPDGRQVRFAANGDGTFQPPSGMYATLGEVSGGGWRLMDKSSISYLFDAQGRLTKIVDARNRALDLERDTGGKLTKVTAPGGRFLTFTYSGDHVASVSTPPVDGTALTWTYTYSGEQLTQVCAPVAAPNCTTIEYATGSLYRTNVLNSDPLGYWRLNEPAEAENAADSGRGAGSGYYVDATLGQSGALSGTADKAASFNGDGWVALPPDEFNKLQGAVSFETWFKTSSPGAVLDLGNYVFGANPPYHERGMVYVGTDGKLRGQLRKVEGSTPIAPITSSTAVNNNAWHHVVLTMTETEQRMYLDGQQVGVLTGTPVDEVISYAVVGHSDYQGAWPATLSSGTMGLTGSIDEVALYDRPLSLQEAQAHYAARAAVPYELTKITQASGRVWVTNTYDAATDRLKTHTDQHGGLWKLGTLAYTATTGLSTVTVTDPKNNTLKYTHDAWRGYRMVNREDQIGKITSYTYDTGGFLAKTTDPNGNTVKQANDVRGNVTAVTTCRAAGNCQTAYRSYYRNASDEFDPRNDQVITDRDARSTGATDNTYATTTEYTTYGELAKTTTPATSDFPSGRSDVFAYTDGTESAVGGGLTPAGLLKSDKDAKGNETTYRYTVAGDLAEQTSPSGLVTVFTYDALGRVTSRKEIFQANPSGVTTTFTYDGAGRLLTQTAPGVKNEVTDVIHTARATYTYDADGNQLTETVADLTGGDAARTTTYAYDAYGRVESVTGPEGSVLRTTWDNIGARVSTTDPLGVVTTFGYTKRGDLEKTTLKNWVGSPISPKPPQDVVLESYSYDFAGRLDSQVDAMGRKISYTYFGDDLISQVVAANARLNGSTTPADVVLENNTYDAAGNLTRKVVGGGKETDDYVYDAAGRLTSNTFDPAVIKRKTVYAYDAADNLIGETVTGAGTSRTESAEYAYNSVDQVVRQTIENGADDLVSTWTYDDRGLLTAATDPRGNASGATAADFTTALRYDVSGQLVEVKSPQVEINKNGTSVSGRPTVKYGYDTAGLRTHAVDEEGRAVTSAFDKAGRLTSVTLPSYTPPGGTAITPKASLSYDAAGNITNSVDARGYATSTTYDALGNPVRVIEPGPSGPGGVWTAEYDLLGEQLATVDPTGARLEMTYDDLGRRITRTQIERKPTTAALTDKFTYDTAGNLVKSVDPDNKATVYTVDAAGQATSITDPLGHASTFNYDFSGRTTKVADPLGNATEASYDLAGRQITAKDLDNAGATVRTFGFGYDAAGNQTSTTSGEGHVTRREFDALSQTTSLIEPISANKSITTTFGYDAVGARTRLTDGRGNTTWTTYNTLGLVETVVEPATTAHPAAADRTWTDVYDAAGNPVSTLQPGGARIDREFDPLGQVVKETGTDASVVTPERTYTYDQAGRTTAIGDYTLEYNDRSLLTKVSKAANSVATYAYNKLGNPVQRVDPTGTATFTWDNADRLRTTVDPVTGRTWTYNYDNADRLTGQTSTGTVNAQAYTYDAVDRITSQTLKNGSGAELAKVVYGWDKDDNLTSKTTSGTAGAGTNTYTYDRSGRLTSWAAPGGAVTDYEWDDAGNRTKAGSKTYTYDERNRLLSGDGVDYTYTPRGTLASETKSGVVRNLTYDAFDRLIADGDATYGYDALGRLTSRTKGTDQRRFVYSGLTNDIAVSTDGAGTVQAKYGRDPFGGLLGLQENGTAALGVMSDLHGDVVGTFSGTALVDSVAYDPFGQVLQRTGTARSLGYQGEYTDPDTGKVNMHARWYQPGTGAFTSRDDWTLDPSPSVQANRYTYVNSTPLTGIDPTGHTGELNSVTGGLGGAGGFLSTGSKVFSPSLWGKGAGTAYTAPAAKMPSVKAPPAKVSAPQVKGSGGAPLKKGGGSNSSVVGGPGGSSGFTATKPQGSASNKGMNTATKPQGSASNPKYGYTTPAPTTKSTSKNKDKTKSGKVKDGSCGNSCLGPCKVKCGSAPPKPKAKPKPRKEEKEKKVKPNEPKKTKPRSPDPQPDKKPLKEGGGCVPWLPCPGHWDNQPKYVINADGTDNWDTTIRGIDRCSSVGLSYSGSIGGCAGTTTVEEPEQPQGQTESSGGDDPGDSYPENPPAPPVSCDPNSFVPGTKVLMADGTTKPIEEVKVGDEVIASDPKTGMVAAKPVSRLITGNGEKHLVRVVVGPTKGSAATGAVVATDGHPFWVENLRTWVKASELLPGMVLRTSAGTYVQVTATKKWTAHQRVHNLSVDDLHTYYVVAGNQAVLVHNAGDDNSDDELVRVGRWMSPREYKAMLETGMVQSGGDDRTYVVHPPSKDGFKPNRRGSLYVEFDVPLSTLIPGGRPGDYKMSGPGSFDARVAVKKGLPIPQFPPALNIVLEGGPSC